MKPLRYIAWPVRYTAISLVLLAVMTEQLTAQEMAVPADIQIPIFGKILSFDRNLKSRTNGELVVGIVYQQDFRASLLAMDAVRASLTSMFTGGTQNLNVTCIPIDYTDIVDLRRKISENHVNILYLTPMRSVDLSEISSEARTGKILTLTGVPEYVEAGIAVGITIKGDKPLILINLPSARGEGADFNSRLLNIAKVYLGDQG